MSTRAPRQFVFLGLCAAALSCGSVEPADLLLLNGRVYTMTWADPDGNGEPAADAPFDAGRWHADAEAIAVRGGRIVFIGSSADAELYRGPDTVVRDVDDATMLPGLIDSHVHLAELGATLDRVDLVGVDTEAEAVARVAARAASAGDGEWIVGWGWDEGAWASRYPDMRLLSEQVPNHPVVLRGLHSFATWGNRLAFEQAGITATTQAPTGGEILKDASGRPTGILTNNAGQLLMDAMPPPMPDQLLVRVSRAIETLAASGYVAVHEAGADSALMEALRRLDESEWLKVRVYRILAARDAELVDTWQAREPERSPSGMLSTRSVKAFYDGAMGSRGAYFFDDYADRSGHRGLGGADYGFDADRMAAMMRAGYQLTIHAIGDRANRETLDLFEQVMREMPAARDTRPRIEHAQVLDPADVARFASLGVIASMQPSHAVEDMAWAEDRVGPDRIGGAYAWRSLRRAGARLVLNSDLPGTDYDFFYGLHSAVTRQNREGEPRGGWRSNQALTIDEAVRGWTTWAAWAGFEEDAAGVLAVGRRADITVVDIDPFEVATTDPARLLTGGIVMTIGGGHVLFERR